MLKDTFITKNFYLMGAAIICLYVLAYAWPGLFLAAQLCLAAYVLLVIVEWIKLHGIKDQLSVTREVPMQLSLSDGENVSYNISNNSDHAVEFEFYDELPPQFQFRSSIRRGAIEARERSRFEYHVRPYERGEYDFGKMHLFYALPPFRILQRRISVDAELGTRVIPSIKQMKKHELQVFSQTAVLSGIRKVRQVGENDEFEHIRPYSQGDNIKAINWKATSRYNDLMVNQYQNSRHQDVYCVLDKGRSMKMPFDGMTLLDYSINSILSLSNIILKKYDHAGLISFSDTMGSTIKASAKKGQLERISQSLYNEETGFQESNFELLLQITRRIISRRSIWLFFTNFETPHDLHRQLPYLRLMCKRHLVIIVIFINTELQETSEMECQTKSDIYLRTFAEKAIMEKQLIKDELVRNGLQTILTRPKDLSINVINKYLEIKARRLR